MANWCDNTLTVHGPADAVTKFETAYAVTAPTGTTGATALSLALLAPVPTELLALADIPAGAAPAPGERARLEQTYGTADVSTWQGLVGWGTKWDVDAEITDRYTVGAHAVLVYRFSSAWSPPLIAVKHASQTHPDLMFDLAWSEEGNDDAGHQMLRGGRTVGAVTPTSGPMPPVVIVDQANRPVHLDGGGMPLPESLTGRAGTGVAGTELTPLLTQLLTGQVATGGTPEVIVKVWADPDQAPDQTPAQAPDETRRPAPTAPGSSAVAIPAGVTGIGRALVSALLARRPDDMDPWDFGVVPADVGDGVVLESDGDVMQARVLRESTLRTLIADDLLTCWWDNLDSYESWEGHQWWMVGALAEQAEELVAIDAHRTLTAQLAVCADVSPDAAAAGAAEVLDSGAPAAAAVRMLVQLWQQVPELNDLVTALLGTLTTTNDEPAPAE